MPRFNLADHIVTNQFYLRRYRHEQHREQNQTYNI